MEQFNEFKKLVSVSDVQDAELLLGILCYGHCLDDTLGPEIPRAQN
jgi:hypothetical protein